MSFIRVQKRLKTDNMKIERYVVRTPSMYGRANELTTYPSGVQLMTSHFIVMFPLGSNASNASGIKMQEMVIQTHKEKLNTCMLCMVDHNYYKDKWKKV